MELALVVVMVVVTALLIARPLRSGAAARVAPERLRALEAARDVKLREIRDAELDLRTGKLSAADHRALDAQLRAEAVALLDAVEEEGRHAPG